jgi:enolase
VAKKLKLERKVDFGIDAAATDIKKVSSQSLRNTYKKLIKEYHPIYIEDPFGENDFKNFSVLTAENAGKGSGKGGSPKNVGKNSGGKAGLWIAGDDLTTTNTDRMELAHAKKSINAIIIKPNQIGTVTETLNAVRLAREYRWAVVVSHRSGETNDTFIADLAYGVGAEGFKLGAPARGERIAKYNRLLEIEGGK